MIKVLENPLYYLENFHRVLEWIAERYSDLLDDEEAAFIAAFPRLPQASRALFVRMAMRQGALFRANKLVYPEIGAVDAAIAPLLAAGWVRSDPPLTLEQLFGLLQKPELVTIFNLSGQEKSARKAEQLAALQQHYTETQAFSVWHPAADAPVYEILNQALCDRLRLIFFGNFRQGWSEFVLSDLGVYRYEKVEFSLSSRGFRCRRDIDDYLALQQCRQRFQDQAPAADVLRELADTALDNDWLASRRERLRFHIGQQLEKSADWDAAFAVYEQCAYPGARVRAIRVLEKSGRHERAFAWFERAAQQPESEAEQQQLLRIAPRLRRQLGHARQAPQAAAPVDRIDLRLPPPNAPYHVEGVVRDHLGSVDAPVYYVENTLINSLFGLLCWDAIFTPVAGAFFHPFHRGPADLHSSDFRQRRAAEFAACLAELDNGAYRATIERQYAAKAGIESPFVVWQVLDRALLDLALDCIPAAHLKKWCERILLDIHANRSGLPDLIQFWPAERRYRMIEVKGPGDRLQDNQKRWLAYCAEHAMPVSVCYLEWSGDAS